MADDGDNVWWIDDHLGLRFRGRVTSITRSGSTTYSFTYNGLNARMTRSDSNGSRTMLRDGADVLAPVIKDGSKEYAPGLYQWDSGNGSKPFVTDRLGSVTKITDWQGNSPASQSFDAFGVQQSGSTSDLFGFAGAWGYQSDADHGLQLLGHRMYDPDLGRFLTRDPIKDGRNWYGYCENNPVKFVDPLGLFFEIIGGIGGAIAGGAIGGAIGGPPGIIVGGIASGLLYIAGRSIGKSMDDQWINGIDPITASKNAHAWGAKTISDPFYWISTILAPSRLLPKDYRELLRLAWNEWFTNAVTKEN